MRYYYYYNRFPKCIDDQSIFINHIVRKSIYFSTIRTFYVCLKRKYARNKIHIYIYIYIYNCSGYIIMDSIN